MSDQPAYEVARITITRELHPGDDGDLVGINLSDGLTALEALGMLALAQDYVLNGRDTGQDHDRYDDEDY